MDPPFLARWMDEFFQLLSQYAGLTAPAQAEVRATASSLAQANNAQFERALETLAELASGNDQRPAVAAGDRLWVQTLLPLLMAAQQPKGPLAPPRQGAILRQVCRQIADLYATLGPNCTPRHALLAMLAQSGRPEALEHLVRLLVDDPPVAATDCVLACAALFQKPPEDPSLIFPRLSDAIERPATAAVVLDLANYWTERGIVSPHPAAPRATALGTLCGAVTQRLQMLVEKPVNGESVEVLHRQVDEGVALVASLSTALALIGDEAAIPRLHQVLQLPHRRLRTEAAAALAKLGDDAGIVALLAMAAQPVVRSAALGHLKTLGAWQRIPEQFRSDAARAEGELASWLARPEHYGLAPQAIELVDARRLFWPGFPDEVDSYLFRYQYALPQGHFSNVGIAGPLTFALRADLADLPPADIYAAYAGWHAEHPEIRETSAGNLPHDVLDRWDDLQCRLIAAGYETPELVKVGRFFEDEVFVASASRGGHAGAVVADRARLEWYPAGHTRRPLGPTEAYYIHKGRKLLRSFNPQLDQVTDAEPEGPA